MVIFAPPPRAIQRISGRGAPRVRERILLSRAGVQRITRRRFAELRAHAVSKLSAITFVALILLPFTAPFRSYDLAQSSTHASDALPKDLKDKAGSESAVVPPTWSLLAPALTPVIPERDPVSRPLDSVPLRHVALRI